MFSLALAGSTSGALPAAREETDDGVVGLAEAVEDGVAGRTEDDGVVGRAKAADGVAGRPPEVDDGVVGRAEAVEEGVDGRPPEEALAGGGGAAAAAGGAERRDRNGEILERVDLDDDIAAPRRWGLERSRDWGWGLVFCGERRRARARGDGDGEGSSWDCFGGSSSSSSEAPPGAAFFWCFWSKSSEVFRGYGPPQVRSPRPLGVLMRMVR